MNYRRFLLKREQKVVLNAAKKIANRNTYWSCVELSRYSNGLEEMYRNFYQQSGYLFRFKSGRALGTDEEDLDIKVLLLLFFLEANK